MARAAFQRNSIARAQSGEILGRVALPACPQEGRVNRALAQAIRERGILQARCREVEACVARVFAIPHQALGTSTRGTASVARARQVAMYLCHTLLGSSLTEVGTLFERDRTTVGHACRMVEDMRDDQRFDVTMACLERAVGGTFGDLANSQAILPRCQNQQAAVGRPRHGLQAGRVHG